MLDSPVLVDQNMVSGSNKDQRDNFPRIHLDVSLFSGLYTSDMFPFDPPTQSDTYSNVNQERGGHQRYPRLKSWFGHHSSKVEVHSLYKHINEY